MTLPSKFATARQALAHAAEHLPEPPRFHRPPGLSQDKWWALVKYAGGTPPAILQPILKVSLPEVQGMLLSAAVELSDREIGYSVPTPEEANYAVRRACRMYNLPIPLELELLIEDD